MTSELPPSAANLSVAANPAQADSTVPKTGYLLYLYVAGNGSRSVHAIANLKWICEQYLKGCYQLEVIDLYEFPERARDEQIIAIPTLVREQPLPVRRIIGDLSNTAQVCASLDICLFPNTGSGAEVGAGTFR